LFLAVNGFSQNYFFGIFHFYIDEINYTEVNLKSDLTYTMMFSFYGKTEYDTGVFEIRNDTAVLYYANSLNCRRKFVKMKYDSSNYFVKDYKRIVKALKSDSVFDNYYLVQLTNNDICLAGIYLRYSKFYELVNPEYKVQNVGKRIIITHFYKEGQIKSIKEYLKGNKNGLWYYYNKAGIIIKAEEYRRNRLINTFANERD